MHIVCSGGGPAGLYAALLLKQQHPNDCIEVFEQKPPNGSLGAGLILPEGLRDTLRVADAPTAEAIEQALIGWDTIAIQRGTHHIRSGGHRLSGIARQQLIEIFTHHCHQLGVILHMGQSAENSHTQQCDLMIAAEGVHSPLRQQYAAVFQPRIQESQCLYLWLITSHVEKALTLSFQNTPDGWFHAHVYPYADGLSSFIIEAPTQNWQQAGLLQADANRLLAWGEATFADLLQGRALRIQPGASKLIQPFKHVQCESWVAQHGRYPIVLMGDAAHTTHFSIGSGTRLALEDAIALAHCLKTKPSSKEGWMEALGQYEQQRRVAVRKLQNAARNSQEWFENVALRAHLTLPTFAYSAVTRSQRMSHEDLRRRDPAFIHEVESAFAAPSVQPMQAAAYADKCLPLFTPYRVRDVILKNRIVVSPMAQYQAKNGMVGDYHLMHLGARALGGAALVMTEMTSVSPQGRITPACAGIWNEAQMQAWARITQAVHEHSDARIGIQLGHAGPKGSTPVPWHESPQPQLGASEHDDTYPWPLISASALPYDKGHSAVPRAMTRQDMDQVLEQFKGATRHAAQAGFDWLELHCAHGYLLSAFISPLTNRRTDEYGGDLTARLRYPLEVFTAIRSEWLAHLPISVRISACDWVLGGTTPEDAVEIAKAFKAVGADMIDCSSGQVSPLQQPIYGRMYQTPFSDRIRQAAQIPTIAVGAITDADQVNGILAAGRADLCAIGRPHLAHPAWTLEQAVRMGSQQVAWPHSYASGQAWAERYFQTKA